MKLKEKLNEKVVVTRWQVLEIGMIGMFAGAALMFIFALAGML